MQTNKNKKQDTNMKLLLITFSLITFSLNAQDTPLYEQITSNVPELNEKTEVYLGDRMLIQREGEYRECIVPKKTYERRAVFTDWVIKAKQPLCKRDADDEFYHPPSYSIQVLCNEGEGERSGPGCITFVGS